MNTLHLKYALEIEKSGSISQAAQNLFMAQPNLSKAIKDLENEIGYAIFKRTSSGVIATEKGAEFLYHTKKALEQIEEIEKLAGKRGSENRQFKISIPRGSYIANGFTAFVASLEMTDGMDITINETNTLKTISNVADRGYNMGIIRYQISDEEIFRSRIKSNHLEQENIWEFEYVLVMSKHHPLATKEKICEEDLQDYVKITHADIEIPHERKKVSDSEEGRVNSEKTIYVYERGSQFDLLANVRKKSEGNYVYNIQLKANKKIEASPSLGLLGIRLAPCWLLSFFFNSLCLYFIKLVIKLLSNFVLIKIIFFNFLFVLANIASLSKLPLPYIFSFPVKSIVSKL